MNTTLETEQNYDATDYPRVAVTTDIVIFTIREKRLHVLLIRRKGWPFAGDWALPGGFVRPDETLDAAAARELEEEAGVRDVFLEQLRAFGDPGRDPREFAKQGVRVITVAYTALISSDQAHLRAETDAADARWFPQNTLPQLLSFDHAAILSHAVRALRVRLDADPRVAAALLPARFTLTQLQEVYEVLQDRSRDKRNFRKWIAGEDCLVATKEERRGAHRPALLHEFKPKDDSSVSPISSD